MDRVLKLYHVKNGVVDSPFPSKEEQIEIYSFSYDTSRMSGAPRITAKLSFPRCLDKEWDETVYTIFEKEKYFLMQTPSSKKENTDLRYSHDLSFVSERAILDNVYFYDVVSDTPENPDDRPVSNSTKVFFYGNVSDFVKRLNHSLKYSNVGYTAVIDSEDLSTENKQILFEDKHFTEVLQEIYNTFKIPYYFEGKTIHIGKFSRNESLSKILFKYGFDFNLLSVSKNNANSRIINRIAAEGSEENIPYYYPNATPFGEIEPIVRTGNFSVRISDAKLFREKVSLSDEFKFNGVSLPDMNQDTAGITGQWMEGYTSALFMYTIEVDNPQNIDISFPRPSSSTVQSASIRVYELREDDSPLIKSMDWRKGGYSQEGRIRVMDKSKASYSVEYIENYASAQDKSKRPVMHNNISFVSYEWYLKDKIVSIGEYGIAVNGNPVQGDVIGIHQTKYIKPVHRLMPPIYRSTLGKQRFYSAKREQEDGTIIDYKFDNEYKGNNPFEQIERFEDIKPTIKGIKNVDGLNIDTFAEIAFDEGDNNETVETENGLVYKHPYFFAKLHKTDGPHAFNLFDSAIEGKEMTINITSGHCGGHAFTVGVDKNERKYNTVQVDETSGRLLRYTSGVHKGEVICGREGYPDQPTVAPQKWQQNTMEREVWIALKKDNTTNQGQVMPLSGMFEPMPNKDTFVITNIKLPTAYITAAEERLREAAVEFLKQNNSEKFNFSIKFSKVYFAQHPDVLAMIRDSSKIRIEYDKVKYDLYVNSFSYKVNSNELLPEVTVELKDDVILHKNTLEKAINDVQQNIILQIANMDIVNIARPYFLSKVDDDVADNSIRFNKKQRMLGGTDFGDFRKGVMGGNIDNYGNAELANLVVRNSITTMQYVINRLEAMEGDKFITESDTIEKVFDMGTDSASSQRMFGLKLREKFKGYVTAQKPNNIIKGVINDVANGGGYSTSIMRVNSVDAPKNYIYVTLYKGSDTPSGINKPPCELMNIVRFGNQTEVELQRSIYMSSLQECITFLDHVSDPKIKGENIALLLGKLPDIAPINNFGVVGDMGLYAKTILCQRLLRVDYNGDIITERINRGEWSKAVADNPKTSYRYVVNSKNKKLLEQHTVYHNGVLWACMKDKTKAEPSWGTTDWAFLEGDDSYHVEIESDMGFNFNVKDVATVLVARVYYGKTDITDEVMSKPNTSFTWSRHIYVNGQEQVKPWSQVHPRGSNTLRVGISEMGDGIGKDYFSVKFTCDVSVNTAKGIMNIKSE